MHDDPFEAAVGARQRLTVILLLGVAALTRLYGCWALRHNLNLDAGVVTLMSRHIAQGRALPVFFYGQAYMGALEPWISGLFCRLFGISGFAVCLGTAVVAWAILPVVYVWTRDIAGHRAGCFALAYLLIGPGGFYHYSVSPRGAYAAMLLFGSAVMWFGSRMALRWKAERVQRTRDFLLLGFLAGLAVWSGFLSAPAILSAGLILLLVLGPAVLSWRLPAGIVGFLAGSAPLWIYNIRHDWASFSMTATLGRVRIRDGLRWLFFDRFTALKLPADWVFGLRALAFGLFLAVLGTMLWQMRSAWRRRLWPTAIPLATALIFLPVFALVFSMSHFAAMDTPRYLLPLVPVAALGFGVSLSAWTRRLPIGFAFLAVAFVLAMQVPTLRWAAYFERRGRAQRSELETLANELHTLEIRTLYASKLHRAWNFALEEAFVFSDPLYECYRPYATQAETVPRIGILNDYGNIRRFLSVSGGKADRISAAGHFVHHDFKPPEHGWRPLEPESILALRDAGGGDHARILTDGRIDTVWRAELNEAETHLELELKQPVSINGLRLMAPGAGFYPRQWSLWGWSAEKDWFQIMPTGPISFYFWSGSRPYFGEPFYRLEIRFAPREVKRLRMVRAPDPVLRPWHLHTVQPMIPCSRSAPFAEDLPELMDVLAARGVLRLYADRAAALSVHEASEGRVWTPLAARPFGRGFDESARNVAWGPGVAFLVSGTEAALTRKTLAGRGLAFRETPVGSHLLFDAPPEEPWKDAERRAAGLHWAGFGLLSDHVPFASALLDMARAAFESDPRDPALPDILQASLDGNPYLHDARRLLARVHAESGESAAALENKRRIERDTQPGVDASIRFRREGIEFLGYRIEPPEARPGQAVNIRYYWRISSVSTCERLAVFVHFMREGIRFQDDHVFMSDVSPGKLAYLADWPIAVERTVKIPDTLEPGSLDIQIGLYDRRSGVRLKPRTVLNTRRDATRLADALVVLDATD